MNDKSTVKPPMWFWIVGVIALLWNLIGVSAYLSEVFMSEEVFVSMPEAQQALYESRPSWATAAFAIAIWSGLLGSIALLLKKKWAKVVFILSLVGILLQQLYHFFLSNTFDVMRTTAMILPILIVIFGLLLVIFADFAAKRNWLS
ncbi:hypothetical protein H4O18_09350 [Arenibacter sp. BSSL-BM3]|uniref:Sugar transporter n=1 Tax=Arenibacter arenosicollis TaxID=2762274 RepID=A0ABR7QML3_9FLAO|nr:hypothetical protein [Arenibacter arenosicollis]MBC8768197.1 hypothetical protein [Arenibacter arenosicollis]